MPKRTRTYASWQMQQLASPGRAASYLNATLHESPELFLSALEKVAQAHRANEDGEVDRPATNALPGGYSEQVVPTLGRLSQVLGTIGLQLSIVPMEEMPSSAEARAVSIHAVAHP